MLLSSCGFTPKDYSITRNSYTSRFKSILNFILTLIPTLPTTPLESSQPLKWWPYIHLSQIEKPKRSQLYQDLHRVGILHYHGVFISGVNLALHISHIPLPSLRGLSTFVRIFSGVLLHVHIFMNEIWLWYYLLEFGFYLKRLTYWKDNLKPKFIFKFIFKKYETFIHT